MHITRSCPFELRLQPHLSRAKLATKNDCNNGDTTRIRIPCGKKHLSAFHLFPVSDKRDATVKFGKLSGRLYFILVYLKFDRGSHYFSNTI